MNFDQQERQIIEQFSRLMYNMSKHYHSEDVYQYAISLVNELHEIAFELRDKL
jgi:hypothetical protein